MWKGEEDDSELGSEWGEEDDSDDDDGDDSEEEVSPRDCTTWFMMC